MKRSRKVLSLILPVAFAMAMMIGMTVTASALEPVTYIGHDENGTPTTGKRFEYVIIESDGSVPSSPSGWYVVTGDVVLEKSISVNNPGSPFNLILRDGSKLTVKKGFSVTENSTINIYAESDGNSKGELIAAGSDQAAGIGNSANNPVGTINIHGGKVTTNGGKFAAGIGGGYNGAGGKVTIYGGTVKATGNYGGAGIGGGSGGIGGEVTIFGGKVIATGETGGAGIGGGYNGAGGTVTINGGSVVTEGGEEVSGHGKGIGAGINNSNNGSLTLGANVTLYGGDTAPSTELATGPNDYVADRYRYMKTMYPQTIVADDVTATYGDTDNSVEATVTVPATGGGAISYAVKEGFGEYIEVGGSDGVLTINKVPSDGIAYVTATAAATDDYASGTKDIMITIGKATPEFTAPEGKTLKYTGKAQELVTAGTTSDGVIEYALGENDTTAPEGGWDTSIPKGTDAKTYYVWYRVVGDENHYDTDPFCVTVKIEPVAAEYTITFDLNGGSMDGQTGTVAKKYKDGTVITMPAPTREGYTFDYWEGSAYYAGDKYTVSGDHTFKAVWKTSDPGKDDDDTDDSDDSGSGGDSSDSGKSSSGKKGVKTGDENALTAWIALMLAAMAGTTWMVFVS